MASILQKLLRKQSVTPTIISKLNKQILTPPILAHLSDTNPLQFPTPDPIPFSGRQPKIHDSDPPQSLNFYPSFSFGAFLNPISPTGFVQSEVEDVVTDDSHTIWADSVKKKRKKKMNKHKLRKLRKRLRRKT